MKLVMQTSFGDCNLCLWLSQPCPDSLSCTGREHPRGLHRKPQHTWLSALLLASHFWLSPLYEDLFQKAVCILQRLAVKWKVTTNLDLPLLSLQHVIWTRVTFTDTTPHDKRFNEVPEISRATPVCSRLNEIRFAIINEPIKKVLTYIATQANESRKTCWINLSLLWGKSY